MDLCMGMNALRSVCELWMFSLSMLTGSHYLRNYAGLNRLFSELTIVSTTCKHKQTHFASCGCNGSVLHLQG